MNHSIINSKGQITIPKAIKSNFNLVAGNKIQFIQYDKYFIAIPINKSVSDLKGALPKPSKALSCEEMNTNIFPPQ